MARAPITSSKTVTVSVVRRSAVAPAPGSAEVQHRYDPVFTTRAMVKTMTGGSDWAGLEIDGTRITHKFTIRYTRIPFDSRDRLRDALGNLYQIVQTNITNLGYREIEIMAAAQGLDTVPAAR